MLANSQHSSSCAQVNTRDKGKTQSITALDVKPSTTGTGFECDLKINCNYHQKSKANLRESSGRQSPRQNREQKECGKLNSRISTRERP